MQELRLLRASCAVILCAIAYSLFKQPNKAAIASSQTHTRRHVYPRLHKVSHATRPTCIGVRLLAETWTLGFCVRALSSHRLGAATILNSTANISGVWGKRAVSLLIFSAVFICRQRSVPPSGLVIVDASVPRRNSARNDAEIFRDK